MFVIYERKQSYYNFTDAAVVYQFMWNITNIYHGCYDFL